MLVCETSSTIPTVKWFFGEAFFISSKTPLTIAGVNSFDERPYRPPVTRGKEEKGAVFVVTASAMAVITSW